MATETGASVGIYLRISEDPDGTSTATARQREDCTRYAKAKGWAVSDAFEDVDLSAFKANVKRPEFERMLSAVKAKAIDGVLAWKLDRISRRMKDFVRLDEECEAAGGFIATVTEGVDTRTSTGRFVAELMTAQARMESENTRTRVLRVHETLAKQGRANLGGTRAFGLTKDRKAIVPEEAALIREAAARIFAGETIKGILKDWQARGVTTPTGRAWAHTPFRTTITSARLSGQREHRGVLSPGLWPAILSPEETHRLRLILRDPSRQRALSRARTYLLSGGLIRCALCGANLIPRPNARGVRRYICAKGPGMPGCGKLARVAEPVEETVAEMIFTALEGADIGRFVKKARKDREADLFEEIREDEAKLEELAHDYYVDKAISRAEFFTVRDDIQARLDRNRARMTDRQNHGVLAALSGNDVRQQWQERGLDWRRAVVAAVLNHVVLLPVEKASKVFDPTRLEPIWRA